MKDTEKEFLENSVGETEGGIVTRDHLVPKSCHTNKDFHEAMRNAAKEIGLNGGRITDTDVIFFGSSIEVLDLGLCVDAPGDIDAAEKDFRDKFCGEHNE